MLAKQFHSRGEPQVSSFHLAGIGLFHWFPCAKVINIYGISYTIDNELMSPARRATSEERVSGRKRA